MAILTSVRCYLIIALISISLIMSDAEHHLTILNNSGESGHPCLVPDLKGNTFSFSPLRIIFAVGLSSMAFSQRRQCTPLHYSCLENPMGGGTWWAAVHGVAKSQTRWSDFTLTFHFQALEKEMATHSIVLACRIPGTAEPGGLPSMGSHRVRHDWSDLAAAAACWSRFLLCPFFEEF